MTTDIITLLNRTQQMVKDLTADRDACLERAKRAEQKCADQKAEHERKLSKVTDERDKLLRIIEHG